MMTRPDRSAIGRPGRAAAVLALLLVMLTGMARAGDRSVCIEADGRVHVEVGDGDCQPAGATSHGHDHPEGLPGHDTHLPDAAECSDWHAPDRDDCGDCTDLAVPAASGAARSRSSEWSSPMLVAAPVILLRLVDVAPRHARHPRSTPPSRLNAADHLATVVLTV
jgi:hypothetical protein